MTRATRHRWHILSARYSAAVLASALVLTSCTGDDTTDPAEHSGNDEHSSAVSDDPDALPEIEHRISIVLCDDLWCPRPTGDQIDALQARLDADDDVVSAHFVNREEAVDRLLEMFHEPPEFADSIDPDRMAESFDVRLHTGADAAVVVERYEALPDVQDVAWISEGIEQRLAEAAEAAEAADVTHLDEDSRDVSVFLCNGRSCPSITESQRTTLRADLESDPDIVEVAFESSEDAYEVFLERFGDHPEVDTDDITAEVLPESFRLTIDDDADPREVSERYESHPGVDDVVWGVAFD